MNRGEEGHRHAESQDPPAGGEDRHVHVVEHEQLIPKHRQPVEILWTLVMGEGDYGRLKTRDVRFERDRDLVSKTSLHAGADRPEEPGCCS